MSDERQRVSILCGTVTEDEIPHLRAFMAQQGRIVTLHKDADGTIYWDAQKSDDAKLLTAANSVFQA